MELPKQRGAALLLLGLVARRDCRVFLGPRPARKFRPQAISLDLRLPDMEGYALLDYLKHNAELRHVPVVVLSGGDDPERALRAGAFAYMKKPAEREDLVQALLKIQVFLSRQPKHLLIVEDNDIQRRNLIDLLAGEDVATESAGTADEALEILKSKPFDCLVLDLMRVPPPSEDTGCCGSGETGDQQHGDQSAWRALLDPAVATRHCGSPANATWLTSHLPPMRTSFMSIR